MNTVFLPVFHELNSTMYTKDPFLSNIVHKCVYSWTLLLRWSIPGASTRAVPVGWMFIYPPKAVSKGESENLAVHPTILTTADQVEPQQPRSSTSSMFTSMTVWEQPPGQLQQQAVCRSKEFPPKLSESESGSSSACSLGSPPDLSPSPERLEETNARIQWRLAGWRGVLFTDEPGFRCSGQLLDGVCGWAVCCCCGGVMVGVRYEQHAHRETERRSILRAPVGKSIHDHHLMTAAGSHTAPCCKDLYTLQEAGNIPVPAWPASPPGQVSLSVFGMIWISGYIPPPWAALCEDDVWRKWWSHQIPSPPTSPLQTPPKKQSCGFQSGLLLWPVWGSSEQYPHPLISILIFHFCEVGGLSLQRRSALSHSFRHISEQFLRETALLCT